MGQSIQEWTTTFSPLGGPLCPHKKKVVEDSLLEYFVPYIGRIAKRLSVVLTKNKFSTKFSSFK